MEHLRLLKFPGSFSFIHSTSFLIFFFTVFKLCIHLFTINNYELHADELYYIELSRNFSWGYLDISPFVSWVARFESVFGESVTTWRSFPVICSSLTVMLTGMITKMVGGKRLAVGIACSAILCSPAFLATSYLLQPAVFDQFFWTLVTYALLAYHKSGKLRYLYLVSVAFSLGMLNKYTIVFFMLTAVFVCLVSGKKTRKIELKKLTGPLLLSILILLPNLTWQYLHGFPILNYSALVAKGALGIDVGDYFFQLFFFHGAGVAVWTAGLGYLLFQKKKTLLAQIWLLCFFLIVVLLLFLKGKLYYGLGIFPILFAYGGYCWALMFRRLNRAYVALHFAVLYAVGLFSLPLVIPVWRIEISRIYFYELVRLTGFTRPFVWQDGKTGTIPEFFADMTGWEDFSKKIMALSISQPAKGMVVLTDDYAITGALRYYGKAGFPQVVSVSNSFSLYAPKILTGKNVIYLSKKKIYQIKSLAKYARLSEVIKIENAHLSGVHVYLLYGSNSKLQAKYNAERELFYSQPNISE